MKKILVVTVAGIFLAVLVIAGLPQLSDAAEIYGCVSNRSGALRIVSNVIQCTSKESPISWNQAGPQGPAGTQGPAGIANGMSRVVMGSVAGDGTVIRGTGFQAIKNTDGPGIYTIIFTTPFVANPICLCSTSAWGEMINNTERYVVCGIDYIFPWMQDQRVVLRYPADGSHVDGMFSFICAEP